MKDEIEELLYGTESYDFSNEEITDILADGKTTKKDKVVKWFGSEHCDFCHKEITDILIDGKTTTGSWATMCESCHSIHGYPEFGPGIGQKYKRFPNDDFVKIEG